MFYLKNIIIDNEIEYLRLSIIKMFKKDSYLKDIIFAMFNNNLNISKTASQVYMHRNSINNKLDYICKETGLDIQNFYDAVAMNRIINR